MTMIVYTFFFCKSVSSTMFSYIYMQIVFDYFAIFYVYICLYFCIHIYLYLYVDCTLLCGGNKE